MAQDPNIDPNIIPDIPDTIPNWRVIVEQSAAGLQDADAWTKSSNWLISALLQVFSKSIQYIVGLLGWVAAQIILAVAKGMRLLDPAFGEVAKASIALLFDVDVAPSAFTDLTNKGGREQMKRDVGTAMFNALTGLAGDAAGAPLEPSAAPAERYLGTIANFAIEGWLTGIAVELESLNYLEHYGDLKDTVGQMYGFGRLTRRILGPAIDVTMRTPLEWQVHKTYRPTLLGAGEAARQLARGRWTREQVFEELARAGYSDERIEALLNAQQKFLSPADVRLMVDRQYWTGDEAIQHLVDQGYDKNLATTELTLEGARRIEAIESAEASAIVSAYAQRDIDASELRTALEAHILQPTQRALLTEEAELKRELNRKWLTGSEAAAAVKAGILAFPDYRSVLAREGYTDEDILTKELLLRYELNAKADLEAARAEVLAERAAAQTARAQAAAAKAAAVEQQRALARLGSLADLKRAVVLGLIPIARYADVLTPQYDAETVQVLVDLVEADRQTYLTQQQAKADALKRAAVKAINVGQLEAAVYAHVLSPDELAARLTQLGMPAADVAVIHATVSATLADRTAAANARAAAALKAKTKGLDLARFEQLVRRGVRTLAEYDALLASLGYDDGARAGIEQLLTLKIADDQKAAQLRADKAAADPAKALSLDQARRAVLLGLQSTDWFQTYLVNQDYGVDDQAVLVAELEDDVTTADAARAKRAQAAAAKEAQTPPLSTVARAAKLGLVSVDTYQQRLEAAGYTPDDVAIELDLLTTEMASVAAAQALKDAAAAKKTSRGLTLADVERAVKAGTAPIEAYRSAAVELGYDAAAVDTLVTTLTAQVDALHDAAAAKASVTKALSAAGVDLAALEAAVAAGTLTTDAYIAQLEAAGVTAVDAELLGATLEATLLDHTTGG
jgi:hypothetical protein